MITRLFKNRDYDKNGIFRLKFWQAGAWHHVNVDDRLPSDQVPHGGKWVWHKEWLSKYSYRNIGRWKANYKWAPDFDGESINKAWWMPIMEKAYAKFDQNYQRIVGGSGQEGLSVLTGAPVASTRLGNRSGKSTGEVWSFLKRMARANYPMTTGCHSKIYGLISGHAYSVLDVKELLCGGRVCHRLVKVRNPWSSDQYHGPFSDKSGEWTADFKAQVGGVDVRDDGISWMPLHIWRQAMGKLSVAYTDDFEST